MAEPSARGGLSLYKVTGAYAMRQACAMQRHQASTLESHRPAGPNCQATALYIESHARIAPAASGSCWAPRGWPPSCCSAGLGTRRRWETFCAPPRPAPPVSFGTAGNWLWPRCLHLHKQGIRHSEPCCRHTGTACTVKLQHIGTPKWTHMVEAPPAFYISRLTLVPEHAWRLAKRHSAHTPRPSQVSCP